MISWKKVAITAMLVISGSVTVALGLLGLSYAYDQFLEKSYSASGMAIFLSFCMMASGAVASWRA